MRLADYLSTNEISDAAFASRIGVSRQALHRYRRGERMPRPDQLHRIREATDGAVTADDFLPARDSAATEAAA